jgi:putative Mn2+ efflux pump MntP
MLAALTESNITNAIVWIGCMGLIIWLLYWLIGKLAIPEPFNKIAYAVLAIVSVVFCIRILFKFAGNPF